MRPDLHHETAVEMTRADEAGLAVVEPVVGNGRGVPGKQFVGASEIQPAMFQGEIALRRIEGDLHELIVPPINGGIKIGHSPVDTTIFPCLYSYALLSEGR